MLTSPTSTHTLMKAGYDEGIEPITKPGQRGIRDLGGPFLEGVEPAPTLYDRAHRRLGVGAVGDITPEDLVLAADVGQQGPGLFGVRFVAQIGDRDARALAGQLEGDGPTQAAGPSGDEAPLSFRAHVICTRSSRPNCPGARPPARSPQALGSAV